MTKRYYILISFLLFTLSTTIFAAVTDYLILQDIGSYKFITQTKNPLTKKIKTIPGYTIRTAPGILAGTDHFDVDHDDTTYETKYESDITDIGLRVQVTQHAGSDSDKWLLHEVERGFRFGDYEEDMTPSRFRNIDGNNIFYTRLGGGTYRWLSNNVVVSIQYTDLYQQKPEPLEIVNAYLVKFPSTIPTMTIDRAHTETWLKDEMERRLWLADKWTATIQPPTDQQPEDPKLPQKLKTIVDNLNIFLDYRQKYYNIAANTEKRQLEDYRNKKDKAAIQTKLNEYKTWWSANKTGTINLP